MKCLVLTILSGLLLSSLAYAQKESPVDQKRVYNETTGLEWLEMSAGDRVENLIAAMLLLDKNGVKLSYAPDHYYDTLYQKLQRDPALYSSSVTNILADDVYEKEPLSRESLDKLKNRPKFNE